MIYRVNMTNGVISREPVPEAWRGLGGRALTSAIVAAEVPPTSHPLGPHNKLVFAPGILGGSKASSAGRLSVGGKSPLTGGIKESNVGGTAGDVLAQLGIKALIVEGQPPAEGWYLLRLSGERAELLPADDLVGLETYETTRLLLNQFGSRNAVLVIGTPGEHRLNVANIGVTDVDGAPSRHAARGGLGAVMGSKRLKAIVVEGTEQGSRDAAARGPVDPREMGTARRRYARALLGHPTTGKSLPTYGTSILVHPINELGGLPTRNFRQGQFEMAEAVSGEHLRQVILERGGKPTHTCMPGCVIRCSNVYPAATGDQPVSGFEFETIVMNGPNLGIGDLDVIAHINRLCDDYGMDTIEVGATLGVAMEAGIIPFGDGDGAIALVEEMRRGTPLGRVLGSGAVVTGRVFGVTRVPAVKGQAMAAYDPRRLKGTGVTYATSPMGADHTAGNALPGTVLPGVGAPDPTRPDHQVLLSRYLQQLAAAFDSMGLCWFSRGPLLTDPSLVEALLIAQTGGEWTMARLLHLGWQTVQTELRFNRAAGFTSAHDRLPDFFREEGLPPTDDRFDVPQEELEKTLSEEYVLE